MKSSTELYSLTYQALLETDIEQKLQKSAALWQCWQQNQFDPRCNDTHVEAILVPGRPSKPVLVPHQQVKQRKLASMEGRIALLHAVAHIEFNAINLALDAVYRFRDMPAAYYGDWLKVAAEEAYHFSLLRQRLQDLGANYGDLPAHNGLWEHACKTDHDVLVRMALVPRVLEARGLDVTPPMMQRLQAVGDQETVDILAIILRDEIGHVQIGSYWYRYCCEQRGLEPEATFRQLLREVLQAPVRTPFYEKGRLQAGFSQAELHALQQLEAEWLQQIAS